jgi:flavin reductase (DIM6/NTAB) family NADH-FMN oxidoreductase RutF
MPVDVTLFKAGMRRFPGAVCLITAVSGDGTRNGLTATAVCSVTVEPPTLLVCINRSASAHNLVRDSGHFAVNVVTARDQELAARFAGADSGEARFVSVNWSTLATGSPVLESALTVFDCKVTQIVDIGSHSIVFGEVQAVKIGAESDIPLLYLNGEYGEFKRGPGAAPK